MFMEVFKIVSCFQAYKFSTWCKRWVQNTWFSDLNTFKLFKSYFTMQLTIFYLTILYALFIWYNYWSETRSSWVDQKVQYESQWFVVNGLVLLDIKNQIIPVWFDYYDHYNLECPTHHLYLISICLRLSLKRDWIHYLLFHLTAHCLPYMAKTCTQNKYWIKFFQCDLIIMIITTWYASLNLQ